jgi:hypothetical protein
MTSEPMRSELNEAVLKTIDSLIIKYDIDINLTRSDILAVAESKDNLATRERHGSMKKQIYID